MLRHWRANVDLQIIEDVTACSRYLTKYVAKCEPRSIPASEIYSKCVSSINPSISDPTKTVIRKYMIQSVGERDFSAQETAHLLQSLPLYSCSFNFVTVSLDGNRRVLTTRSAEDLATEPSLLDSYANRMEYYAASFPDVNSLHLVQFVSKYSVSKADTRTNPVVVYKMYLQFELVELYRKYVNFSQNSCYSVVSV